MREEKREMEARYEKYRKECVRLKTKLQQEQNRNKLMQEMSPTSVIQWILYFETSLKTFLPNVSDAKPSHNGL